MSKKSPKFINTYKLSNVLCDLEGVPIDALKVGETYEVTHYEHDILDEEENVIMTVKQIEINGFVARVMPDEFDNFFEGVDGEKL